jgi:hypothetical protein
MNEFMDFSFEIFYNTEGGKRIASGFRIADFGLWNEKQEGRLVFVGARGRGGPLGVGRKEMRLRIRNAP